MNSSQRELKCDEGQLRPYSSKLKPCFFDVRSLGTCGKAPYGYTIPIQPCVLIKFNKVSSFTRCLYRFIKYRLQNLSLRLFHAIYRIYVLYTHRSLISRLLETRLDSALLQSIFRITKWYAKFFAKDH